MLAQCEEKEEDGALVCVRAAAGRAEDLLRQQRGWQGAGGDS